MYEADDADDIRSVEQINQVLRTPELAERIKDRTAGLELTPFDYLRHVVIRDLGGGSRALSGQVDCQGAAQSSALAALGYRTHCSHKKQKIEGARNHKP